MLNARCIESSAFFLMLRIPSLWGVRQADWRGPRAGAIRGAWAPQVLRLLECVIFNALIVRCSGWPARVTHQASIAGTCGNALRCAADSNAPTSQSRLCAGSITASISSVAAMLIALPMS